MRKDGAERRCGKEVRKNGVRDRHEKGGAGSGTHKPAPKKRWSTARKSRGAGSTARRRQRLPPLVRDPARETRRVKPGTDNRHGPGAEERRSRGQLSEGAKARRRQRAFPASGNLRVETGAKPEVEKRCADPARTPVRKPDTNPARKPAPKTRHGTKNGMPRPEADIPFWGRTKRRAGRYFFSAAFLSAA